MDLKFLPTPSQVLQCAKKIDLDNDQKYIFVYPKLLKYFEGIGEISPYQAIIGISMVYSWMPTILEIDTSNIDKVVKLLNKAKRASRLAPDELNELKKCFNNSLVGASKLLHFINPKAFPIWDSRVFEYVTQKEPYSYRLSKPENYLEFMDFCNRLMKSEEMPEIKKLMEKQAKYKLSNMRALDMVFFYAKSNNCK